MELEVKLPLNDLQDAENVNELLTKEQSKIIGSHVLQTYKIDKMSRYKWEEKSETAEKLALQVKEQKTYPWPEASNVKFPLVTIAAMQFQARAYPALIKTPDLVKFRVQGKDDGGEKASRSERVSAHMSYQLLEEDEPWEEHQDKALLALPIVGCIFKKSYYDKTVGHNRSTLVLPKSLVIHYFARSIEECERKTEVFQLSPREIKERQLSGVFSEVDLPVPGVAEAKSSDEREGLDPSLPDEDSARTLLEQHCYLDLDGDGYKEPYIVTIFDGTGDVCRIKSRFEKITTKQSEKIDELQKRIKALAEGLPKEGQSPEDLALINRAEITIKGMQQQIEMLSKQNPKVIKIDAVEYYTKYGFIPSPDGGFYDLGFGALLGPLNDSVDTLINQIIDAGSMNSGAIGFIGKGARLPGGKIRFQPNEFIKVNATGSNIRDAIVPLNLNPPSDVLLNLLSLLINYSERVGSVTDTMVGENPGQNTPAYNMQAMIEQGSQVFNGIFKRIYRSMRSEFRKLYKLNSIYLDQEKYFSYHDSETKVLKTDYTADPKDLMPAADPSAFSSKEKTQKAMLITERAQMVPGYNPIVVEKKWLASMEIPDSNELYPLKQNEQGGVELVFPPQPDPEFEIKRAEEQRKTLEGQSRHDLQIKEVEIKMMLAESQVMKMIGDMEAVKDKDDISRLELQLKDMISKREALTDIAVAQIKAKSDEDNRAAAKGVA